MIRIAHLLDDFAMGGVTRALSLFDDPRMTSKSRSVVVPMRRKFRDAPVLDADLIVIHVPPCWSRLPYLAALRHRNPQARIVQVEHSYTRCFEQLRVSSRTRFRLLLRTAAALVDEVICVSHGQADWLAQAGVSRTKISTIHPWSGRFELSRIPDWLPREGPLKLLTYGRFSEEKNFISLLKAMRHFTRDEVELTLFGSGPEKGILYGMAHGMANVHIQPACPDPALWLSNCDAVILPSLHEAFGLVATEARMAGRAILVADVDGLPEQAAAGGGLVAPLGTAEDIVSAIRNLIRHDLRAMGRAARSGVSSQHEDIIKGWVAVLKRAADHRARHSATDLRELASA